MAVPIALCEDSDGPRLRQLAKATKDAAQARRLLALAEIYDGGSRTEAWFTRADARPAPIDAGVVAAEQGTIDLYVRNGLIPKRIEAADILDTSFNPAMLSGASEAAAR